MLGKGVAVAVLTAFVAFGAPTSVAASSHEVEITSPEDGATVEGTVTLRARTTGVVTSVLFEWAQARTGPWTTIGPGVPNAEATVWTLQWDTDGIDGPVVVRATASDGTSDVRDTIDLVLDNQPDVTVTVAPDPFSPNGDGRKDGTTLRVDTDESGRAVVEIVDAEGRVRRRWRADISRTSDLVIEWNGRADGRTLADGRYRVRVAVTDDADLTGRDSEPLVIDTRPPRVSWIGVAPEPLRGDDRMRFRFRVRDRGPVTMRVEIEDRTRRVANVNDTVRPGERTIRWRPRYAGGGALYPGQYDAALRATDEAGNRRRTREIPWRVLREVQARVYTRLSGAGPRVALTFDDCYHHSSWRSILGTLRSRGVDATFFCNGSVMTGTLIRQTVRQGHVLGSHTWDHRQLTTVGASGTTSRILRDAALTWSAGGQTTAPYFRPPYGAYNASVIAGAREAEHPRVIMWDVDTLDWQNPGSATIARRAVGPARSGSIILMHALPQTASALNSIITGLQRKGLRPVTIAELFAAAGYRSG